MTVGKTFIVHTYCKRSPGQYALFLAHVSGVRIEWPATDNPQDAYDGFYTTTLALLDRFYPERQVTLTSSDPKFMTPTIKAMLHRRNKLIHTGHVEKAKALSLKVEKEIIRFNSASFRGIHVKADPKGM